MWFIQPYLLKLSKPSATVPALFEELIWTVNTVMNHLISPLWTHNWAAQTFVRNVFKAVFDFCQESCPELSEALICSAECECVCSELAVVFSCVSVTAFQQPVQVWLLWDHLVTTIRMTHTALTSTRNWSVRELTLPRDRIEHLDNVPLFWLVSLTDG